MKISIKNLKKYYDERLILDIKNLNIEKGKITGIIGPNGSGKSTLLNIIGGLDYDYNGVITYDNKRLDKEIYKNMTVVFQKPYLFRRTVYENISYPLKVRKFNKKEINSKVLNILSKLNIEDLKNNKGNLLSGGEMQKVNLARALIFQPKVLLLDEPMASIDFKYINTMENIIKDYRNDNNTIIIVIHNIDMAKQLCDKLIYLNYGKVDKTDGIF
ncbi:energy-coupling factor ABC transporter ATP-binding protein [Dethiothermospora halolimnae]|uniref:energy-coupling factor ABC transporter ATP-binding protein n=1 Tax=Dethiothermospora halolimnae TaxID=3114390 RepID=UPI003CCBE74F